MQFTLSSLLLALAAVATAAPAAAPAPQADDGCFVTEQAFLSLPYAFSLQLHTLPNTPPVAARTIDKKFLAVSPSTGATGLTRVTPAAPAFTLKDQHLLSSRRTAFLVTPKNRSRWREVQFGAAPAQGGLEMFGGNACDGKGGVRIELRPVGQEGESALAWCVYKNKLWVKSAAEKGNECVGVKLAVVKKK
ncbi:hypothetical protein EDC01DRAFT_632771 [Geopyxis carbonaria]|nr:hypothetical protein EDC01DRAFT_632771 [Geopyxis carbonaria]